MVDRHVIIIGGGLAGMSCGSYLLRNGYRTTILEHNLALGGVCTTWKRHPYTVDGCIHWLTGGPFARLYEELGILPAVGLRTLEQYVTYRNVKHGVEVVIGSDLDALVRDLTALSPRDTAELERMRDGARRFVDALKPPLRPLELMGPLDGLRMMWQLKDFAGPLIHFRKPMSDWTREHLHSPHLRRLFSGLGPDTAPALFLLMVLGYLERGYLSRPVGGTEAFRGALEHSYRSLGGEVELHATVDEILVEDGKARGVRLADGTMRTGDFIVSTSSTPETVLRLLGGRYDADATVHRMRDWKMFDPIVLCSFGVEQPYSDAPGLLSLDGLEPQQIAGRTEERLYVRVCNDDASYGPAGHCVLQCMVPTSYDFWATCGDRYSTEKDTVARAVLQRLEPHFPKLAASVRMTDLATPLTYWNMARSWRGAFEGWMPTAESLFGHVRKELTGVTGLYLAGQWVEPGGGVPTAILSGRQAAQLLCERDGRTFLAA
jgi:phytoene dehydrogenase-like protein